MKPDIKEGPRPKLASGLLTPSFHQPGDVSDDLRGPKKDEGADFEDGFMAPCEQSGLISEKKPVFGLT